MTTNVKVLLSHSYIGTLIHSAKAEDVQIIATQEAAGFGSDIQAYNWPDVPNIPKRANWLPSAQLPSDNRWFAMAQPPCFTAGTPILTKTGFKPVETVAVGDEVFTHKGRWRKVSTTMNRTHSGDVFDFESPMARGEVFTTTGEHPFWQGSNSFIEMKELFESNDHKMSMPFGSGETSLPEITSKHAKADWMASSDFWWVIGLWIAEGHCRKPRAGSSAEIYISGHEKDEAELIGRLTKFFPGIRKDRHNGKAIRLAVTSAWFYDLIKDCSSQHNKVLPSWTWSGDQLQLKALWDGYIYGDGRRDQGHSVESSSCSRAISHQMAMIYQAVTKLPASIKLKPSKGTYLHDFKDGKGLRQITSRDQWVVSYTKQSDKQVKNQHSFITAENVKVTDRVECKVKIVKRQDTVLVYNLSVEEDESYCAAGVMTHNCAGGSMVTPTHARGGLDNPKSAFHVTHDYMKYIYSVRPPIIAVESVPGTLKFCGGDIFRMRDMYAPDYGVFFVLDNSSRYGCVSIRKRLWHIHYRKDLFPNGLSWEQGEATPRSVREALEGAENQADHIVSPSQMNTYNKFIDLFTAMPQDQYCNNWLRKSGRWDLVPAGVAIKVKQNGEQFLFYESMATKKLSWDATAPTITGSTFLMHPELPRPLTTREYLRINNMPDSFRFPPTMGAGKHVTYIGKTVSTGIAQWVIRNVKANLDTLN